MDDIAKLLREDLGKHGIKLEEYEGVSNEGFYITFPDGKRYLINGEYDYRNDCAYIMTRWTLRGG